MLLLGCHGAERAENASEVASLKERLAALQEAGALSDKRTAECLAASLVARPADLAPPRAVPAAERMTEEAAFLQAVATYVADYNTTDNDIKKAMLREHRSQRLKDVLKGSRQFTGWGGKLRSVKVNGDGNAYIEVALSDRVTLKTWSEAGDDAGRRTLIRRGTPLYATLAELKVGDPLEVGGEFIRGDGEFVRVNNLDEHGSGSEPVFIVRFVSITKR